MAICQQVIVFTTRSEPSIVMTNAKTEWRYPSLLSEPGQQRRHSRNGGDGGSVTGGTIMAASSNGSALDCGVTDGASARSSGTAA
jgi:hypothetical protein